MSPLQPQLTAPPPSHPPATGAPDSPGSRPAARALPGPPCLPHTLRGSQDLANSQVRQQPHRSLPDAAACNSRVAALCTLNTVSCFFSVSLALQFFIYAYTYKHIHTHIHVCVHGHARLLIQIMEQANPPLWLFKSLKAFYMFIRELMFYESVF